MDVQRMLAFIDAAPSPFHAVDEAAARLDEGGFEEVREVDGWPEGPGRRYLRRGGSLVAWVVGAQGSDKQDLQADIRRLMEDAGSRSMRLIEVEGTPLVASTPPATKPGTPAARPPQDPM